MLNLHKLSQWVHSLLVSDTYGLPEDVYNDVIPSGVHDFNRTSS